VLSVLSGSALLEAFVSEVLDSGRYRKHVDLVRARLARMRRDSRRSLEAAGIAFDTTDGEGIFLWGRVPDSIAVDELVRAARDRSILLAKGALFSPSERCRQWLRFNVAHSAAPPLAAFLCQALKLPAQPRRPD